MTKVYPATATLAETERACEEDQRRNVVQITKIENGVAEIGGKDVDANIADYADTDIGEILNDLKFIDISTPAGASEAAAASGTYTPLFDCRMFIEGDVKDVKVLGRKV
jgi:hypothetical protein